MLQGQQVLPKQIKFIGFLRLKLVCFINFVLNKLLGNRFPRENARRHKGIYNIYWLLTRLKFVQLLTQLFPSNLEVQFTRALS